MLDVDDQSRTAFGVKLNIAKSLLWFNDYVELVGAEKGRYIGRLNRMDSLQCTEGGAKETVSYDDMWAVKRDRAGRLHYFGGYSQDRPVRPCLASADAAATLSFRVTHRVQPDGSIVKQEAERHVQANVADLRDVVRRTQF